jgi:hypothetical protein
MVFFTRTLQLNPEGEERKKEEWKKYTEKWTNLSALYIGRA